jgi:hypothetical protein
MSDDLHATDRAPEPSVELLGTTVLTRALDVGTRLSDQVSDAPGALLLETMLGRYLVDGGGEKVGGLIDGRRSIGEVVTALVDDVGGTPGGLTPSLAPFLEAMSAIGLVEIPDDVTRLPHTTITRIGGPS